MKRSLLMLFGGLVLALGGVNAAGAQSIDDSSLSPTAQLSAPLRVPGGSTFFVRSVDPCPAPRGTYSMIRIGIEPAGAPAGDPAGEDVGLGTQGWVNEDGSWEVKLQAPSVPADQPTLPFTIQAICVVHTDPYYVNPDPATDVDNEDLLAVVLRYYAVPFWSTSSGGYDHSADATDASANTTTTTSTSTTTTSSTTTPPTTVASFGSSSPVTSKLSAASSGAAASPASVDDIRAELAAQGVDVAHMSDAEVLLASPAASHRPLDHDGGLPWWSFVLATMLAVGAVVAWGARRDPSASAG